MARIIAVLACVAALAAFSGPGAQADMGAPGPADPVAVSYEVSATQGGILTIVGGEGLDMESWSADGQPVAAAVLITPVTQLAVPVGPVGPDGLAMVVRVGDNVLPVAADPDWNWD